MEITTYPWLCHSVISEGFLEVRKISFVSVHQILYLERLKYKLLGKKNNEFISVHIK
jgi:hypothetical protein